MCKACILSYSCLFYIPLDLPIQRGNGHIQAVPTNQGGTHLSCNAICIHVINLNQIPTNPNQIPTCFQRHSRRYSLTGKNLRIIAYETAHAEIKTTSSTQRAPTIDSIYNRGKGFLINYINSVITYV